MDRGLAVLLTALAGGLIALQPPINAELGRFTGNLQAALVSFLVGAVLLAGIVVLSGKAGTLSETFQPGWIYYLGGGVLGAVYVAVALITVSSIGAAGVVAGTIAGQLTASVVIDRLGVLGLEETAVSVGRLVGIALLFLGTYLIGR
jgi:bacterial/archaeal transporter family-2 protein